MVYSQAAMTGIVHDWHQDWEHDDAPVFAVTRLPGSREWYYSQLSASPGSDIHDGVVPMAGPFSSREEALAAAPAGASWER
jgi:hypothetical protein